ncbi:MAG TPA: MoxR family ATPase [Myxococcota bacterium]|nr:MoxR family ATPase [Myxococcota bacterium]HOA13657.1 MoxR family ATPase [Myxococcota bacterium]HOC98324.1 MoxR family ATPase [Myxococcota bacterium]HOH76339.1 MoxR family ATPase [Myxococcota bacterium]HPV03793.1 MoxR family ATPase [Myxococcota bacterium]
MEQDVRILTEMVRKESAFVDRLTAEVGRVIVGQKELIDRILIALLCRGHVLIEGVPGLAKTLTVKTVADALDATFSRVQFTPDLLPADLTGTQIYNQQTGAFSVKKGPIFAGIVLADEINRAPAKVQSALLEAMQERQVTISDKAFPLPEPFLVLATQNPIEQEGTYPLPEAQIDRFMLMVRVSYPTRDEELQIMDRMALSVPTKVDKVISLDDLQRARSMMSEIYMDQKVKQYIVDLVFATRRPDEAGIPDLADYIRYGASPRATIALSEAARAHAFLRHRGYVIPEDVKSIGLDVLRHRLIPSYEAEAENMTAEDILNRIFDSVQVP